MMRILCFASPLSNSTKHSFLLHRGVATFAVVFCSIMKYIRRFVRLWFLFLCVGAIYLIINFRLQSSEKSTASQRNEDSLSFISTLKNFPWYSYEHSVKKRNQSTFMYYSSQFLTTLLPFLTMPPKIQVNQSCTPPLPKIPPYLEDNCTLLANPRKVAILLQFGFEADILEIHMQELADIVDYFFILESTRSHFLGIQKPLIWEVLKHQKRFEQFVNQTVHLVLDDVDTMKETLQVRSETDSLNGGHFGIEYHQEKLRWLKFYQWNRAARYFQDDDILGFGDVDEIPSRDAVFYLKHCELPSDPVDIGIWYPYGNINQAHDTDWPVPDHPYTLGDPTFWTMKTALHYAQAGATPSRNRGKSLGYLLGGMHMSHYGYLPVEIVEYLTASEAYAVDIPKKLAPKLKKLSVKTLRDVEIEIGKVPKQFRHRIISVDEFKGNLPEQFERVVYLPWFFDCNRKRYPTWEGMHDTRLD